jgi:hypothetical protein
MHIEFCTKLNFLEGEYAITQNIGFLLSVAGAPCQYVVLRPCKKDADFVEALLAHHCTVRGCGYFYSGPKSTRKYVYSLFWNHVVAKTQSLHVLAPCIRKPENERAVPDRATQATHTTRSGTARSFSGF